MILNYFNGIIKIPKDQLRDGALQRVTDMGPVIDMDYDNIWIYVSLHVKLTSGLRSTELNCANSYLFTCERRLMNLWSKGSNLHYII